MFGKTPCVVGLARPGAVDEETLYAAVTTTRLSSAIPSQRRALGFMLVLIAWILMELSPADRW